MPVSDPADLVPIVEEYYKSLKECEDLYRSCAEECTASHLAVYGQSEDDFLQRMVDLSHGLMLKIFLDIAGLDPHWSREVVVLAGELFEFVWNKRLKPKQLREALGHFQQTNDLTWSALLGPFQRLAPFGSRSGRLQTVVMRLANLVAKANGRLTPEEVRQLRWIQAEMRRLLEPIPLAGEPSEAPPPARTQAIEQASFEIVSPPGAGGKRRPAVVVQTKSPEERLAEGLADLDGLIGLTAIKHEVRGLINFLKVQQAREQFDLPQTPISLHHVFSGNPGTGKTTVARLLGHLFGAMGLLAKGHLVETDRSGLVAEYAGQTAPKAHKKIDEALDGVLFIDEAYSLVAEKGDDPYGAEALQVLLKRMEDDRNRLVVALAGYPAPLKRLLRSNPGLSSRFNRHLVFPDYSAAELGRIFESLCRQNRYTLPTLTRVKLLLGFHYLLEHRDEHFGNGRLVRNVFEQAIGRLANRITGVLPLTRELLTTLEPEDAEMEGVPAAVWDDLANEARTFRTECPGCQQSSRFPQKYLGLKVQCRRCQASLDADWGEVVTEP
jgi:AAA lid domain/ATPase family associated with various cellular activities (AAA)